MKDGNQKSLLHNWQFIPNFFIAHLPILVRCKTKGAVRALCALLSNWQLSALLPISERDGAVTLKGSQRMGVGSAGIFNQSMGARNRVRIGWSYRPARLHNLEESFPWNQFLGSLKVKKFGLRFFQKTSAPLFNDDLSKEPNFGLIHLAGQYLSIKCHKIVKCLTSDLGSGHY
jgi:hypothetical protein